MNFLSRILQLDLFGGVPTELSAPKKRRIAIAGWDLSDHACRHCLGRVLVRRSGGEVVEARCAECGASADGGHASICCCGADCGTLGHVLECFRNPEITPAVPQEILVRERPKDEEPELARHGKPVGMKDY